MRLMQCLMSDAIKYPLVAGLALAMACTTDQPAEPSAIAAVAAPVTVMTAGDMAGCAASYKDDQTAQLIDAEPRATVITLGDNVYGTPTLSQYQQCYGPSWGRHKSRTWPTAGNHDYNLPGASGYYDYFNGVGVDNGPAGPRAKGYYAKNLGTWRVYVLNSEVATSATGPQVAWLQGDLKANPRQCVAAVFHRPYFTSSSVHPSDPTVRAFIDALYAAGADLVLSGHNHHYERFAPQTPTGVANRNGLRQFVVGTGGSGSAYNFTSLKPNSEVHDKTWGVLKLTLGDGYYSWRFIPIAGFSFTDQGTAACSGAVTPPPPPPPSSSMALTVTVRKPGDGKNYMDLRWTGASGAMVDVYRDDGAAYPTANDGRYTNALTDLGPVTYAYKVCNPGTQVCSNIARVTL